jgi:hypothetical protein
VIVALCELEMVPAVAWKVAVVAPAVTATDGGTVKLVLLSDRLTNAPPLGAGSDSATVQVDDALDATVVGVHASVETLGMTVIVPPVPTKSASVPFGKAPTTLLMVSVSSVLPLVGTRVAFTTATTPLPIAAFVPDATQIALPVPKLQLSVSPAAVSVDPAEMLTEAMAVGEYDKLHCRLAGALVVAFIERFSDTELP